VLGGAICGLVFVTVFGLLLLMKPVMTLATTPTAAGAFALLEALTVPGAAWAHGFVKLLSESFLVTLSWPQSLAASALLASVIISFSPTVTIAIVQETNARGPFTEMLMAVVILGDLFVLVAFAIAAGLTRAAFGGGFNVGHIFGGVGWELFGSMLIGGALGLGMLAYLKYVRAEIPLFLTAVCFLSAEGSVQLHLSPLLLSLAAGAVIANLDEGEAHRLSQAIRFVSLPVFALFFAAAGAGLHLDVVPRVAPLAVGLVAVRALAIYFASRKLTRPDEELVRRNLWMGLISQAGVTFGLAALIARTFPEFGLKMEVLIIAMVTIHELVGPILVRRGLQNAGEIEEAPDGAPPRPSSH
ncbi:MAG: cation:proton antiporter, partial [Myxococcaceae bacterium]|nr:cation:proton antiporter [Myxococcaceae bacterium]